MSKFAVAAGLVFILLIAGNVYQYQNPRTIEIPTGQEAIDSTAWVKRAAVADQETIIDSLKTRNKAMAERIQEQGDRIAGYTSVTGRLKTQVDSLQYQLSWNTVRAISSSTWARMDTATVVDTVFRRSKTFGEGLFQVDGRVEARLNPCGYMGMRLPAELCPDVPPLQLRQDFTLTQKRDLQLDIVTTLAEDNARVLTYVTSSDFQDLKYQTTTQLKQEKEWPWFWIGLGGGFIGAAVLLD